jgi:hypothetical protein
MGHVVELFDNEQTTTLQQQHDNKKRAMHSEHVIPQEACMRYKYTVPLVVQLPAGQLQRLLATQ